MPKVTRSLAVLAVLAMALASCVACASARPPLVSAGAQTIPAPSQSPSPVAPSETPSGTPTATPDPTASADGFDKTAHSIDDPNSYWVVVDKLRPLQPKSYTPPDIVTLSVAAQNPPRMRALAGAALVKLFAAAKAEGAGGMQVQSAWRPYSVQVRVYNNWVATLGKKQADAQSARPGYSEHQTGLAVDISAKPLSCALAACFGSTAQGKWLAKNAWRFGYLLRYPKDKTPITGYTYEPWHFRFIGTTLAKEMHVEGVKTLEEFFDLPAAPDYAK